MQIFSLLKKCQGLIIFILLFGLSACSSERPKEAPIQEQKTGEGEAVKPFKLTSFDGRELSMEALKGKTFVLNFWASWCGPCKIEAPELEKAYKAFSPAGVEFVGVAVQDNDENARKFMEKFSLTFPSGRDVSGDISKSFNIYGVPTTYIVSKDGIVRHVRSGAMTAEELSLEIRKAL